MPIIEGKQLWFRKKYQTIVLRERVRPRKQKTFKGNHTGDFLWFLPAASSWFQTRAQLCQLCQCFLIRHTCSNLIKKSDCRRLKQFSFLSTGNWSLHTWVVGNQQHCWHTKTRRLEASEMPAGILFLGNTHTGERHGKSMVAHGWSHWSFRWPNLKFRSSP